MLQKKSAVGENPAIGGTELKSEQRCHWGTAMCRNNICYEANAVGIRCQRGKIARGLKEQSILKGSGERTSRRAVPGLRARDSCVGREK
ncbi:hypothetical protein CEXT_223881 [Caerostris extrusa]|uniref:Uncharacterized protein n=1 Tax=Caerostris extrusa TaxID=172846 RepID=A0AAV4MTR3_CAEEX|nr:hypothetical protein CEXT_223881 [Caerostris extrusa]